MHITFLVGDLLIQHFSLKISKISNPNVSIIAIMNIRKGVQELSKPIGSAEKSGQT